MVADQLQDAVDRMTAKGARGAGSLAHGLLLVTSRVDPRSTSCIAECGG